MFIFASNRVKGSYTSRVSMSAAAATEYFATAFGGQHSVGASPIPQETVAEILHLWSAWQLGKGKRHKLKRQILAKLP